MANLEHLKILKQGVDVWNMWRKENPEIRPDLSDSDMQDEFLIESNLVNTNLSGSCLAYAKLHSSNLHGANLEATDLQETNFLGADLSFANLQNSHCASTFFHSANLSYAVFDGAWLCGAVFINTNLKNASIKDCNIYGLSAWDITKEGLIQKNLIITLPGEPQITVDDLEVAQFIYLLLNNEKIRDVIETITSKAVLILGRFTEERKRVLDALKDELRRRNYLPIVFDFQKPSGKDLDETVNLLARMSRFIVADVTDAKSIPQELKGFVEGNPSVPVVPLILKEQVEYAMFEHFRRYPWVLPLHEYESPEILLQNIIAAIIEPAEQKVKEQRGG